MKLTYAEYLQTLVDEISRNAAVLKLEGIKTDGLDQWVRNTNLNLVEKPSDRFDDMSPAGKEIFDFAVSLTGWKRETI